MCECEDELSTIKKTGWSKIDAMGIIGWRGKDVSWQYI